MSCEFFQYPVFDWNLYWRYEKQTNLFSFSVCPVGSFLNPDNSGTCEVCDVDTYSSGTNANSCIACASGTTTQGQTGLSSAQACGKYLVNKCTCLWRHYNVAGTSVTTDTCFLNETNIARKFVKLGM